MKRIKWLNLGVMVMFIICGLVLVNDAITLATSTASYTLYGAITAIFALVIMKFCGDYLYDEMQ